MKKAMLTTVLSVLSAAQVYATPAITCQSTNGHNTVVLKQVGQRLYDVQIRIEDTSGGSKKPFEAQATMIRENEGDYSYLSEVVDGRAADWNESALKLEVHNSYEGNIMSFSVDTLSSLNRRLLKLGYMQNGYMYCNGVVHK